MADVDGEELICDSALLRPPVQQEWQSGDDAAAHSGHKGRIIVRLDTPLRFKSGGRYITAEEFDARGAACALLAE